MCEFMMGGVCVSVLQGECFPQRPEGPETIHASFILFVIHAHLCIVLSPPSTYPLIYKNVPAAMGLMPSRSALPTKTCCKFL